MMSRAALSFTEPPGFKYSALAKTGAEDVTAREMRKSGVRPMERIIEAAVRGAP
jgi:hypothetical protein